MGRAMAMLIGDSGGAICCCAACCIISWPSMFNMGMAMG